MTQRTRDLIANILMGVCLLSIGALIATYLMTPRPSWANVLVLLAGVCLIAARPVRGRPAWARAQD